MVAKIDKENVAVIPNPKNPTGKSHGGIDVGNGELGAMMGSVGVHNVSALKGSTEGWEQAKSWFGSNLSATQGILKAYLQEAEKGHWTQV
jgi:hypothetical protein